MKGIIEYETKSGFTVARVHYSADPDKDPETDAGKKWLKRALQGVYGGFDSSSWRKEMEIDFRARVGEKVFPELELMKDSVFVEPFSVPEWWTVKGGYDFGKRNPFSYHDYAIDGDINIYAVYECYGSGYEIPVQARMIKGSPYCMRTEVRYADPSIWAEDEHNEKRDGYTSKYQIFIENGITFVKGRQDDIAAAERLQLMWFDLKLDERTGIVRRVPKSQPQFRVFKSCPNVWNELCNLRWADFSAKVEEEKGKKEEIKQVDNHAWDDLKYFVLSLPKGSIQPKPRSKDPAMPLAGELIEDEAGKSEFQKLME